MLLILLVIWLTFGIASMVIAARKGRSGCGFFALGVLLGPFGVLFAMLAGTDVAHVEQAAISTGDMKKCPACAELIKREAVKCRYCQHEFGPPEPANPLNCSQCNTPWRAGSPVCATCGRLRQVARPEASG